MNTSNKGLDLSLFAVGAGFALWLFVALAVLSTFARPQSPPGKNVPMIEPATRSPAPVAQVETKGRPS